MMLELWLTYSFCAIAVVLAIAFVVIKHPVHAALSFACVVLSTAGVYLLQDAAFVAASTVVVYAGATIIIFMFVLMFAQQTNLLDYDTHKQNPLAAALVAIALAAVVIAMVVKELPKLETAIAAKSPGVAVMPGVTSAIEKVASAGVALNASDVEIKAAPGDPTEQAATESLVAGPVAAESAATVEAKQARFTVAKLGTVFYTRYLLAIEIAGTLLLVATIGAVVIAQRDPQADIKETSKL